MNPPAEFHHDYYIVLCAQMFEVLPPGEKRIIYQLEQSASSRWFGERYLRDLESSLAVLDYSLENIEFLESKVISYPQIYYLPIGASSSYRIREETSKDIDVLFYGDFKSSSRRQKLLDSLAGRFAIFKADDVFSEDIKSLISRSKVVLNLHYYDGAQLEMPRIQECLSLGVSVVSEDTSDMTDYPQLSGVVGFFETGNETAMAKALEEALHQASSDQAKILSAVEIGEQQHDFMVDRFLMGLGILPARALAKFEAEAVVQGDVIALSLPETIRRRRTFNAEIKGPEIRTFDGIRRSPGWIGCGMSYKYLCRCADRAGVSEFTILEDDVLFPHNFNKKIEIVRDYLNKNSGNWDIFSGVIAHLHEDAEISRVETFKGIDFITINKMTSMIYNIYAHKAIKLIADWNPENENSDSNTIDRYLENSDLRIVVAHPYIAGHREDLTSTLWGFQNTQYRDMINESERKLGELKRDWIRSKGMEMA